LFEEHTAEVDWGDGAIQSLEVVGGSISDNHLYDGRPGPRQVPLSLTVRDNYGGITTIERTFLILGE
jgi:hypothetical protein